MAALNQQEALHQNELPFIDDGQHVPVPEINTLMSLSVVIVALVVTTVASLAESRSTEHRVHSE